MSLALLGYLTVIVFLIVICSKKLSPLVSIIAVPIIFGFIGGFEMDQCQKVIDLCRKEEEDAA